MVNPCDARHYPSRAHYRFYAYQTFPFDIGGMDFKAATLLASLDSLGIGSLLALVWHSDMPKEVLQKYLGRFSCPSVWSSSVFTLVVYHYRIKPSVFFTLSDLAAFDDLCLAGQFSRTRIQKDNEAHSVVPALCLSGQDILWNLSVSQFHAADHSSCFQLF